MNTFFTFSLFVFLLLLAGFCDTKRINVGGIKAPKIRLARSIIFVPSNIPLLRRRGVRCYTCEGGENSLCDVSPVGNARQVKCERGYYCFTLRKETKQSFVSQPVTEATNVNNSVAGLTDISARIKRETGVNFTISRGCKRLDFFDGLSQALRLVDANAREKVYAQVCSKDLCNVNDGRLWCYECNGIGYNHECMQNPSSVAKKTMCEWNEACFVERVSTPANSTHNGSSNVLTTVSRGCRRSSMTIDEESKIKTRENVLTLMCRLSSYCNGLDANQLVRGSSGTMKCNSYVLLMIALLSTLLMGFRL